MRFQVIASGSKGNITYIESNETSILIDSGINVKQIKERTDIDISKVEAIFITHEHIDHVKYIESIARYTNAVIYINEKSFKEIYPKYIKNIDGLKFKFIEANKQIVFKDIKVLTLNLQHDSVNCFGYIIISNNKSIAYCTDTGFIPIPYIELLKNTNALIIESNHDIEMLLESNRPWYLKNRILSINGHMSNKICGEILNKVLENGKVSSIVLAHLSEECNTKETAIDSIMQEIKCQFNANIYVAEQHQAIEIIEV